MLVTANEFFGSIGGGGLEWTALAEARAILKSEEHSKMAVPLCSKAQQCCGGFVELFFEVIKPKPQLLIFGAGHVSQAFLEVIAGTQFEAIIIDERAEWIEAAEKKKHQLSHLALSTAQQNPLEWIETYRGWDSLDIYAVVMTHEHALDEAIIEKLVPRNLKYLGLIGSKTKRERFFSRLEQKGLARKDLEKIFCPMGIPFSGKAPKEVALSISIEILQQYYNTQAIVRTESRTEKALHLS